MEEKKLHAFNHLCQILVLIPAACVLHQKIETIDETRIRIKGVLIGCIEKGLPLGAVNLIFFVPSLPVPASVED